MRRTATIGDVCSLVLVCQQISHMLIKIVLLRNDAIASVFKLKQRYFLLSNIIISCHRKYEYFKPA